MRRCDAILQGHASLHHHMELVHTAEENEPKNWKNKSTDEPKDSKNKSTDEIDLVTGVELYREKSRILVVDNDKEGKNKGNH